MNPCFSSFILIKKTSVKKIMIGTTTTGIPYQLRKIYSIYRCCCNVSTVSTEKDILHIQVLQQCIHRINWERYTPYTGAVQCIHRINWERYTPYTGAAAMYPHVKIYSIYRCCCNVYTVSTEKDILHIQVLLQCIHM